VSNSLDNVSRSGLALCADHSGAFGDTSQSFAQTPAAAHERDAEGVFVDVVDGVGRCQDLGLVDVVNTKGFENLNEKRGVSETVGLERERLNAYLAFNKVSNPCLRHDGYGDGIHNLLDHLGVAHAGYATLDSDVCWDALEGHDGCCAGLFRYACLCWKLVFVRVSMYASCVFDFSV
jgi:hypothetical protein